MGNHTAYICRESNRRTGCTREAFGPVVATVRFDVADPFTARVIVVGLSVHVGAKSGVGETEHVRDTFPLNPFVGVKLRANDAEFPAFSVVVPGTALIPKSGPVTI